MKNILICYFSGTGNTKKVVLEYKQNFETLGANVVLYNIEENNFIHDLNNFDYVGIAYPIHAFNAPSNVLDFCKMLKKSNHNGKKKLFIIKTSGEPLALNNISSIKMKKILKKKFVLTNEYRYCMPYNIIFRHTDSMAFKMWDAAQKVIPIDCKEILNDKNVKLKSFIGGGFIAWIFRIEHWGGRFNGKHYKVNEKCINCQSCIKNCPTKNIRYENGEFHFGKNCLMCMRCSFLCPQNAIKIGFFEKWKVNGRYSFKKPLQCEEDRHKNYCKKSYIKYFNRLKSKIENQ